MPKIFFAAWAQAEERMYGVPALAAFGYFETA
jgi:hypothetical protein